MGSMLGSPSRSRALSRKVARDAELFAVLLAQSDPVAPVEVVRNSVGGAALDASLVDFLPVREHAKFGRVDDENALAVGLGRRHIQPAARAAHSRSRWASKGSEVGLPIMSGCS